MSGIELGDGSTLGVTRWPQATGAPAVLMLHGAIENGRIFHSRSGRGLAPYLAARGMDVSVLDLRGRGTSAPTIGPASRHGQHESIVEEIPAAADWLHERVGGAPQHWVAHSWGGVLMAATLARLPMYRQRVASLTFFASKRCVRARNLRRLLYVDLVWLRLAPLVTSVCGHLPARRLGIGSDSETRRSHAESAAWVRAGPWLDPVDGFDYAGALAGVELPPILAFAGAADAALGHPDDVSDFLAECGRGRKAYRLLARTAGHRRDYGHIDMLTAPEAGDDHFPAVVDWIRSAQAMSTAQAPDAAGSSASSQGQVNDRG